MLNPVSNTHQPPPVPTYLLAQSISPKVIAGSEVKSLIVVYSEQPKLFLSMGVSMETLNLKIHGSTTEKLTRMMTTYC